MCLRVSLFLAGLALAVRAAAQPPATGQVPTRFTLPVCPGVFGLAPQQAAYVTGRMRQVAAAAAIPLAPAPCSPNAIVIVTANKGALIRGLEQHHNDYFPYEWNPRQVRALEADPYPAASWQFEG